MARSLLSEHSSLTPPLTSLIGRRTEIARITGLLDQPGVRLVTLTGPGGIGKTRLALAVADHFRTDKTESLVVFASLAPIADYHLVLPTIARAIGLSEHQEQTALERLTTYLQQREALVMLDNVEHLLEAAPEIAELLSSCSSLRILATGREPLHLHGERQFPVSPLSLPEPDVQSSMASVQQSDAVRLFVERANDVAPDFRLTEANAFTVAEISRRLDGVPLALELAAARMKVVSPREMLARLDDSLVLLTGGPRNVPARQRTMREVIQWSYDLLSAEEQRLFRQLSVFAGGFLLVAVEAIVDADDALEKLASLVDKSMVRRVGGSDETTRFGMLDPVRQFASERLMENVEEAKSVRQRHALHFLSFVEGLHSQLDSPETAKHFRRVELEHDNLRAALRWFRESYQAELGLQLAGRLGIFWHQRGYISEGRAVAEVFLELTSGLPSTVERARVLWPLSWLWLDRDENEFALSLAEEGCTVAELHGDQLNLAHGLFVGGICDFRLGDEQQARSKWGCALDTFRELGEDAMVARILFHFGIVELSAGNVSCALAAVEKAIVIARAGNLKMVASPILGVLALIMLHTEHEEQAVEHFRERLAISQELGIPRGVANSLEYLAFLCHQHCRLKQAVSLYSLASRVREISGPASHMGIKGIDLEEEQRSLISALGQADYDAAWSRGQGLTVEQAIDILNGLVITDDKRVRAVSSFGLTPRESDVLRRIAAGRSNREIAEDLFISIRTVERHIENLYRKLDVHSRAEAIDFGRNHLT